MSGAAAFAPCELEAPGKLFLAGEYAVLEPGRMALVAAVDRTLRLSLRPDAEKIVELWHRPSTVALLGELTGDLRRPIAWAGGVPGELRFAARAVELGLRLCAEEGLAPRGFHATFENDFTVGTLEFNAIAGAPGSAAAEPPGKPGLGGSAAASVLALRGAALAQCRTLAPAETLALAAAAHWVEQGGSGSCGDVAASSLGGLLAVRMRRTPASAEALWAATAKALLADSLVEATPVAAPADLRLLAVWSGASADTRALIAEVRAFAAGRPHAYRVRIERISACAESLKTALGAAARFPTEAAQLAVLGAVRAAATEMAALGEEALCFIVTPELARICALASAAGCAGKPSGAGGGDCALVFAFGDTARTRARELLAERGFASAPIGVHPPTVK